jgi:hypothetical protein
MFELFLIEHVELLVTKRKGKLPPSAIALD